MNEQAIIAVGGRVTQGLAVHGKDALPLLAGALGDELLEPSAEGGHPRGDGQGKLIAAGQTQLAEGSAEPQTGVVRRGHAGSARLGAGQPPVQELGHVGADEGRRDEPKVGEGRVAAADVGRVGEDAAEPVPARQLLQGRPLISDGDEVLAGGGALRGFHPLHEVGEQGERLYRGARLAGD